MLAGVDLSLQITLGKIEISATTGVLLREHVVSLHSLRSSALLKVFVSVFLTCDQWYISILHFLFVPGMYE